MVDCPEEVGIRLQEEMTYLEIDAVMKSWLSLTVESIFLIKESVFCRFLRRGKAVRATISNLLSS